MSAKVYGDRAGIYGAGIYGDIGVDYNGTVYNGADDYINGLSVVPGIEELIYDTNKTVGVTVENTNTKKPSSVLETLRQVLRYHEERQRPNESSWLDLLGEGPNLMEIETDYWQQTFDAMRAHGAVKHNRKIAQDKTLGHTLYVDKLRHLIEVLEMAQNDGWSRPYATASDRELYAMLSALQLYQRTLRAEYGTEPGWQRMEGRRGLDAMNISYSESNLWAWNAAWNLLCHDSRFMGGTNYDMWDKDLRLLDDIIGSLSRSMSEPPVKISGIVTSEPIETVSDKSEPDYYPSKEGMVLGYPTIIECRAQSDKITTDIVALREQLDDIFKQSIRSGPGPDVAAACLIEPMIGEYADSGIEIAKPLVHILSQLRTAGKNPIRYASWMTCSGLVAQAKALVKPLTSRHDGCTLFEYQSAVKKLTEVTR